MNMVAKIPKPSVKREFAKEIIRAYKAQYGKYPSVIQAMEESGLSRIVIEPALATVIAENKEPPKLTKAQQSLVEAKLKILSRKLELDFNERVRLAMLEHNETYRAGLEKLKADAQRKNEIYDKLINNYKAIFNEEEFRNILVCLHPDNSASKEKRETAFSVFNNKKFQLTGKN
jgi:hypothetical protein